MSMTTHLLLISASALTLAVAYVVPALWWFVFMFLVPLFLCAAQNAIRPLRDGLLWGLLFWSVQYAGLMYVLYEKAHGQWRLLAGAFLILYSTLYVVTWFAISTKLAQKWGLLWWLFTTPLFFYWVQHHMFFIFNQDIGYCFGNPIVLLANSPKLLVLLPIIASAGYVFILCCCAMAIAQGLFYRSAQRLCLAFLCAAPFTVGYFCQKENVKPRTFEKMGCILCAQAPPRSHERALYINEKISDLILKHPSIECVITPESAYPFFLNQHKETVELWQHNALYDNVTLLIGAYRLVDGNEIHNSCFCIHKSRIINFYDKFSCFPFIEHNPWKKCTWVKELFLKSECEFKPTKTMACPFVLDAQTLVQPILCSDLYFNTPISSQPSCTLICMVNDAWFSTAYMQKLMLLFAQVKSIELQRDIIYVSYTQGWWLSPSTHSWALLQ